LKNVCTKYGQTQPLGLTS